MGSEGQKLFERMKASSAGWKRDHLNRLYKGYGFIIKPGSRSPHDKVYHPTYPQLITFIPRCNKVGRSYINQAIQLIEKLQELQEKNDK